MMNGDPLGRDVQLGHRARFEVFGIPVIVESNASEVPSQVRALFSRHAQAEAPAPGDAPGVRLRVVVEQSRTPMETNALAQWRVPDPDHMLVHAPGLMAWYDLASASGVSYVEQQVLERGGAFRDTALMAPVLMLLNRLDRHPVHAAAVRRGDAALVLHAGSGVGKSTTCYAASRAGIEVLSDDSVRVQRTPSFRVWGMPGRVHLLGDAARQFGIDDPPQRMANGKTKHAVDISSSSGPAFVSRAAVVLLERGGTRVECMPATAAEIVDAIMRAPESTFDCHEEGRLAAARALAGVGGWRLRLGATPDETVPHLVRLLDQLSA